MEKLYARAVLELSRKEGTDTNKLVSQLSLHLKKTGRTKLYPGILRELKVLEARALKLAPTIEVASEKESHEAIAEAKKEGITVTKVHVNHDLIQGWRARSGGMLIDRSAKRGLTDLYRKVTS